MPDFETAIKRTGRARYHDTYGRTLNVTRMGKDAYDIDANLATGVYGAILDKESLLHCFEAWLVNTDKDWEERP